MPSRLRSALLVLVASAEASHIREGTGMQELVVASSGASAALPQQAKTITLSDAIQGTTVTNSHLLHYEFEVGRDFGTGGRITGGTKFGRLKYSRWADGATAQHLSALDGANSVKAVIKAKHVLSSSYASVELEFENCHFAKVKVSGSPQKEEAELECTTASHQTDSQEAKLTRRSIH